MYYFRYLKVLLFAYGTTFCFSCVLLRVVPVLPFQNPRVAGPIEPTVHWYIVAAAPQRATSKVISFFFLMISSVTQ